MKKIILCVLAACCAAGAWAQKITVGPSETTELLSVIMHLSGAEHYNHDVIIPQYRALVDSVFMDYRKHPAARQARELFDEYGFVYQEPMIMATNGRIDDKGNFHTSYRPGWGDNRLEEFIGAINDFYLETNFHRFYTEKAMPCYAPIGQKLETAYNSIIDTGWLSKFTGKEAAGRSYRVLLSYLNGNFNYGLSPFPVISINSDLDTSDIRYPMVLLHEYLHPYINPIIDRNYTGLAASGEVLFPPMREQMTKSGYGYWRLVNYEALVRASVIAYMRERGIPTEFETYDNDRHGFVWVEQLADLLEEYQKQRDKYPTLESFMPEVVKFYNDLAANKKN